MNVISETEVDETYRRGLAALVAHSLRNPVATRQTGRRRVPVFLAMVGLGIPLAALAVSAFVVIDHARRSATPPASSGSLVSKTGIGHTVHITDTHGLVADVIVEKVTYATAGRGVGDQPPQNGVYAVADVLISTTSAIGSTATAQEFNNAQAQFNVALANLARAKQVNDTKAILVFLALVNEYHQRVALLAQQVMPFRFTYQTSDGRTYAVSSGNALVSGFEPTLLGASGLPKGLTYGNVVFDVPSKGGVIRMTDPFSTAVGRWTVPPTPSPTTLKTVPIGHAVHISDSHGLIADVTVENVNYTTSGDGGARPPLNGFYAIADVLISTTSAIGSTAAAQAEFNSTVSQLEIQLANLLAREKGANYLGTQSLINFYQQQLTLLAQQLLPLSFTYETPDGIAEPAFSGNAFASGFVSMSLGSDTTLPEGLTSLKVVFDVPSKGGAIQLTDPLSNVIEQWNLPAD